MLETALNLIINLTSKGGRLLELGAGTGDFTKRIIALNHFANISITDGAEAMLTITHQENTAPNHDFFLLDSSQNDWSKDYPKKFAAVASSMAIHHLEHKQPFFQASL